MAGFVLAFVAPGAAQAAFIASQIVSVGTSPYADAVGDFNGDGKADLAVANNGSDTVSILLGDGHATFAAPAPPLTSAFAAGDGPTGVAVGDLNNDGKSDLAVSDINGSTVTTLLGKGDGTFTAGSTSTAGSTTQAISLGDFDHDGKLDAVTPNLGGSVSILMGKGDGSFEPQTLLTSGLAEPIEVAVLDFDEDGNEDLAVSEFLIPGAITLLRGNGAGAFTVEKQLPVNAAPRGIAAAELNGDGHQDLISTSKDTATVTPITGDGDGGFTVGTPVTLAAGSQPGLVAAGDLNGDDRSDFATPNFTTGTVSIANIQGDGTFEPPTTSGVGMTPFGAAIGDLDGDGNGDIAITNLGGANVSILRSTDAPARAGNLLGGDGAEGAGAAGNTSSAPIPPGWTIEAGKPTFLRYGSVNTPSLKSAPLFRGGLSMFYGGIGTADASVLAQNVDVSAKAGSIDAGLARVVLSGYLGGLRNQDDKAAISATFLGADGAPRGAFQIGPVSAADRHNITTLLHRATSTAVPAGTRTIRVRITFARASGSSNDGFADNVFMAVIAPNPPPAAPPTPAPDPDADGDGVPASRDCNDGDPAIHPGAADIRGNGVDEDCDGTAAPLLTLTVTTTLSWAFIGSKTVLTTLALDGVRAGDKIRLQCSGSGCRKSAQAVKTLKKVKRKSASFTTAIKGMRLSPGAKLTITVSRGDYITRVFRYETRSGRRDPKKTTRCMRPGEKKTRSC